MTTPETALTPDGGPPPAAAPGPIVQSAAIGFRVVFLVTVMLAVLWLVSNFRVISSDNQAVVMRFGRIVDTQRAGLLWAWPRPIDEVRLLPGPDRQLSHPVATLPRVDGLTFTSGDGDGDTAPASATPYLTGDGAVVLLDATLIYRISDPAAYVLAQDHVGPALDRIFRASAVDVAAGQALNAFLVAQSTASATDAQSVETLRGVVRDRLLSTLNARLKTLSAQGGGLGVEIDRVDMTAWLPPGRLISAAQAMAIEKTVGAFVDTTSIAAIERTPGSHAGLAQQTYRNTIGKVLAKAGAVVVIDPKSGGRVLTSGSNKPLLAQ